MLKKSLLLFLLLLTFATNSFAQVNISFTWDTIFLKDTYCRRLSLSPYNHCWSIANKDSSVIYEIDNADQIINHTAGVQSITSAKYSDLIALDSNVTLIGTPTDYMIKYKAGIYSKLGAVSGLKTNNINTLERIGKNTSWITPYQYKSGVIIGTAKGLHTTYNNSTFNSNFLSAHSLYNDSLTIVHYTNYRVISSNVKSRAPLCPEDGRNAFVDVALDYHATISISHSSMLDYIEEDSVNTFVDIPNDISYEDMLVGGKHIWGTKKGLRYRILECWSAPTKFLEGISINKLYEMTFFAYEKHIGQPYEKNCLLIGSDNGLYYDPMHWHYKAYNTLPDSLSLAEVTKGYKINDIEVDSCNSRVWLATDKGIIRLNIHYNGSLANGSALQHPNNNLPVCLPATITANQSSAYSYQWQKDSINIPGAIKSTYNATTAGNYQVTYTYSDGCRTYKDTSAAVKIVPDTILCMPHFLTDTIYLCEGESYLINSNCTLLSNTYQWYKNSTPIANENQNSYKATTAGYYKLKISNCNISKFTDSIYINKTVLPKPMATIDPGKILCAGDSARISVPSGNYEIIWYKHGASLQPVSTPNFRYVTATDNYSIAFKKNNCTVTSDQINMVFNPISKVAIQINKNLPLCEGDEIMLTAHNNSNTYQWSSGATSKIIYTSNAGLYKVASIDYNNCKSVDSVNITLAPLPIFTLGKDTFFCEGYNKPITIPMPGNFVSYAVNKTPIHTLFYDAYTAGQYIITATDANSCSNSDTLQIFNSCPEIFIPNLITPNGDNKNDFFCIEGLLPLCSLEIYNRWGNLVYNDKNYNNDWNGEGVTDGVYYYTFTSPYYNKSWKGWVQITR